MLLLTGLSGCVDMPLYSMAPVDVQVLDAETGEPIPDATVEIRYHGYPFVMIINKPETVRTQMDHDGQATVEIANFKYGAYWDIESPFHLGQGEVVWDGERVPPEFAEPQDESTPDRAVVHLYRKPRPQIVFVVPNHYRGLIKLEWLPTERFVVGQREFVVEVDDDGHASLDAPPILNREYPRMEARFVDGTLIRQPGQLYGDYVAELALWEAAPNLSDNKWLWLIGTRVERDWYLQQLHPDGSVDDAAFNRMWGR